MSRTSHIAMTWGDLRIEAMPSGKVVSMDRAIKVNETLVFVGKDGTLYCPRVRPGCYYPASANFGFFEPLLNGLLKLGVITKAMADECREAVKAKDAATAAFYDLQSLDKLSEKYGLKIHAAQRKKIEAVKGGAA